VRGLHLQGERALDLLHAFLCGEVTGSDDESATLAPNVDIEIHVALLSLSVERLSEQVPTSNFVGITAEFEA